MLRWLKTLDDGRLRHCEDASRAGDRNEQPVQRRRCRKIGNVPQIVADAAGAGEDAGQNAPGAHLGLPFPRAADNRVFPKPQQRSGRVRTDQQQPVPFGGRAAAAVRIRKAQAERGPLCRNAACRCSRPGKRQPDMRKRRHSAAAGKVCGGKPEQLANRGRRNRAGVQLAPLCHHVGIGVRQIAVIGGEAGDPVMGPACRNRVQPVKRSVFRVCDGALILFCHCQTFLSVTVPKHRVPLFRSMRTGRISPCAALPAGAATSKNSGVCPQSSPFS